MSSDNNGGGGGGGGDGTGLLIPLVELPESLPKQHSVSDDDTAVAVEENVGEAAAATPSNECSSEVAVDADDAPSKSSTPLSDRIVGALKTSGFLLVRPHPSVLPSSLQRRALEAATRLLLLQQRRQQSKPTAGGEAADAGEEEEDGVVIRHPTDPKLYRMFDTFDALRDAAAAAAVSTKSHSSEGQNVVEEDDGSNDYEVLVRYWSALERVKRMLLQCIAVGLELPSQNYFADLHRDRNSSALRLLHYYDTSNDGECEKERTAPEAKRQKTNDDDDECGDDNIGDHEVPPPIVVRCKAHSDYGTLTLLLHDGVPGLEAYIGGNDTCPRWTPVPYVEGALVVNIGSLLSDWTNGELLATLHRVVAIRRNQQLESPPRTSIAMFADPDKDVAAILRTNDNGATTASYDADENAKRKETMSVAEYIQWRSGGAGADRSGVAFTETEVERLVGE